MRLLLIIVGVLVGGYLLSDWTYQRANSQRIASFLNIAARPNSVRNMSCDATAIADIVIECEFDFDPADLTHLVQAAPGAGAGPHTTILSPLRKRAFP